MIFFLGFSGHVKERFNDMFKTIIDIRKGKDLGDLEELSTNNRIYIYKNYLSLIKENIVLGYGYKNGEEIFRTRYNSSFNAHNQYLQTLFQSGIIGLFILTLFSISPFFLIKNKMKEKNEIELVFFLILFNFLFESILYRQWGLILVCFTYAIYFQFFKSDLKWFQ